MTNLRFWPVNYLVIINWLIKTTNPKPIGFKILWSTCWYNWLTSYTSHVIVPIDCVPRLDHSNDQVSSIFEFYSRPKHIVHAKTLTAHQSLPFIKRHPRIQDFRAWNLLVFRSSLSSIQSPLSSIQSLWPTKTLWLPRIWSSNLLA